MRQTQRSPTRIQGITPDAFRDVQWQSRALGKRMVFALCLPPSYYRSGSQSFPTLFLLHGSGHDHRSVLGEVRPQDHLSVLGNTILIVPDGDQGWWLDSSAVRGSRYAQYLLELVDYVDARYRTARHRGARGICGFSMGGYGAMLMAARHPSLFGSASSLIGTLDIVQMFPDYHRLRLLLGADIQAWRDVNPAQHAAHLSDTALLFCTAEQAFDRPQNESFAQALQSQGIPFTFKTYAGEHDTTFVRKHLAECLAFHRQAFDPAQPGS